jgi:hypothetical protein
MMAALVLLPIFRLFSLDLTHCGAVEVSVYYNEPASERLFIPHVVDDKGHEVEVGK